MKWTATPPTEPGWYWVRDKGRKATVRVYERAEGLTYRHPWITYDGIRHVSEDNVKWAGPIPEPEEASE